MSTPQSAADATASMRGDTVSDHAPDQASRHESRRPMWPLVVAVVCWLAWFAFLCAMMVMRIQTTPV